MAWSRKSKGKPKIVRKRLADGTIKIYEYARAPVVHAPRSADSIYALITAYQGSPEWAALSSGRRYVCEIYLRRLKPLGAFKATDLRRRDIRAIRNGIASTGRPGAANLFVNVVSAMCGWAIRADWLEHNPAVGIQPIPGGHLPAWSQAQADRAIEELPEHLRRLVLLALYTGQRRGDLCRMAWSHYDGVRIRVTQGKTGTPLIIPVHPVLKAAMDKWPRIAATILTNHRSQPWKPASITAGLRSALERIGFPDGHGIHGLRKLAAANLAEAGCSASEIAAVTGHRSLAMISLYTASADQERLATAAIVRLTKR
jgi:integrase